MLCLLAQDRGQSSSLPSAGKALSPVADSPHATSDSPVPEGVPPTGVSVVREVSMVRDAEESDFGLGIDSGCVVSGVRGLLSRHSALFWLSRCGSGQVRGAAERAGVRRGYRVLRVMGDVRSNPLHLRPLCQ